MQYKLLALAAMAASASAQSLTAALSNQSSLSSLVGFASYIPASLLSATNITVLAPSNAAFAAFLNSSAAAGIATNNASISALLSYHILNGTYYASEITSNATFVPTELNNTAYANVTGGQRVEAILEGSNVTIISGLLQNSTVTTANINFTGGVIHIIDQVLTLPANISYTAEAAGLSAAAGALTATNLADAVDGLSDVTVFVPNNAAFQAIGSAVGNLTTAQLASILEYHVINGTVAYSTDLVNGSTIKTLQGNSVTITILNGTVFVNSAEVVLPNVLVANGVVHVIDAVLNPNATTLTPNPTTTAVAFAGASSVSAVPFTSGVPTITSAIGGGAVLATSTAASSSSTGGAFAPMRTGAIGAAALFAAGGAWLNA